MEGLPKDLREEHRARLFRALNWDGTLERIHQRSTLRVREREGSEAARQHMTRPDERGQKGVLVDLRATDAGKKIRVKGHWSTAGLLLSVVFSADVRRMEIYLWRAGCCVRRSS